ncbi:hypothetical protein [Streptomyces scopuliridis]|uniref:hypothetical protein n=1 Tax=Streptomyces scopuliridis TaxID=452529 RepID=UPI0035DDCE2E
MTRHGFAIKALPGGSPFGDDSEDPAKDTGAAGSTDVRPAAGRVRTGTLSGELA